MAHWLDNRPRSIWAKFLAWRKNPVGGLIRFAEILYLGAPLTSILRAGRDSTIEYIQHLPGVLEHFSQSEKESPSLNDFPYLTLRAVNIHVKTGIVRLNSGHFFTNRLEFQDFASGYLYSDLRSLQHSKPLGIETKCVPLALQSYYYHFLLEDLPAVLLAVGLDRETTILTPPNQPKYVEEALERMQVPVILCDSAVALVDELRIPNRVKGLEFKDFQPVSNLFLGEKLVQPPRQKLLLIRGNRPRGNSRLERDLGERLQAEGYEALDPEKFTVSDQADYFANASHIVSLHGGALTNLIFAPRGTKVFEVHSHSWRNYAFATLAGICDQQYTGADQNNYENLLTDWLASNG
jgi:hypothetical protein